MKVELNIQTAVKKVLITNEHSASSHGIPVAVVDGEAYGPHDVLPIWPHDELSWLTEPAARTVAAACREMQIGSQEYDFARRFYDAL